MSRVRRAVGEIARGPRGLARALVLRLLASFAAHAWYVGTAAEISASGGSLSTEAKDVFSIVTSIGLFIGNGLALAFFFMRQRVFPPFVTVLLALEIVVAMTDGAWSGGVGNAQGLWSGVVLPGIWMAYVRTSKRVEATFVR